MKRFRALIVLFCLALSIPLAFFVWRTYRGLEQEEAATLQFFAAALFDEMEAALGAIVHQEEGRAIDAYLPGKLAPGGRQLSVLSDPPVADYLLGYFQNNPDGSFQSPLVEAGADGAAGRAAMMAELRRANRVFNTKRVVASDRIVPPAAAAEKEVKKAPTASLADRYLDTSRLQQSRSYLGQQSARYEKIAPRQAVAMAEKNDVAAGPAAGAASSRPRRSLPPAEERAAQPVRPAARDRQRAAPADTQNEVERAPAEFQVEVAPLQAVFINDRQIYIFRRIMLNGQIYRQGFILKVHAFLTHLIQSYFMPQPMARFTRLQLAVAERGQQKAAVAAGDQVGKPSFVLNRTFPSPFGFLSAQLTCEQVPASASRRILNGMLAILAGIFVLGIAALYKSVLTVVEHSKRRAQFVSAVTHELKTPLTNIRMYIEMLEQGMARSPEKENEYYRIVNSEGERLSRLINNVLELSKLERRQRLLEAHRGDLSEVIEAVRAAMHAKLELEGFELKVDSAPMDPFTYDREAMIQILINLIENSIKFGRFGPLKQITIRTRQGPKAVTIGVSDTGPGIPRAALKKIFDEFYRVDNSLTRTTRGTGIGLALVKKLVHLMGGSVRADNNSGPGCTIAICLPID